jgi:hypothetical protein
MAGVVVSQWSLFAPEPASSSQIIVGASALTISLVFEIFRENLKSMAVAFHNQQARNGVKTSSVLPPPKILHLMLLISKKSQKITRLINLVR